MITGIGSEKCNVAGFKDGKMNYQSRNGSGLQEVEKAKKWIISLRASTRNAALLAP